MTISFILLASNEDVRYFRQSLQCLYDSMRDGDELLVLFDEKFNPEFLDVVSLVVTCIVRSVCVFVTPVVSFTSRTIVLCVLHEIAKKHAKNAK